MNKLGFLVLPDSMQWTDRYAWSPVVMGMELSLLGTPVVWSQSLSGGRPITLVAEKPVAWLDQAAVEAIAAMAGQAGSIFPLFWGDDLFSVMFRHHDPPAVSFQPVRVNSGLFVGTVKLMTI